MSELSRRIITSPSNPQVKELVALRKPRARADAGVALVDGHAELQLAVAAGSRPFTVFICESLIRDLTQLQLLEQPRLKGVDVVALSKAAFERASLRDSPDGWLAVVPAPEQPLERIALPADPLVLVAEAVQKPGNLGAMLRTAEAAGVNAVIAASPATDWGNPNVVRASKGTVFAVPVASAPAAEVSRWLRDKRFTLVVANPSAASLSINGLLGQRPLAVIVGSEDSGTSRIWESSGAFPVRLPMYGRVNSLNVSVAAAILLYDAIRLRSS